jgi:hypothetical protein
MMIYKYLSALFALSFLAGGVVAQSISDDYTLALTTYTANVDDGVVTFTGVYATEQLISIAAFTQTFKPVVRGVGGVGDVCGTTAYTSGVSAQTTTTTSSSASVQFSLTLSSLVAPVYTAPAAGGIDTNGEVELCHQIEVRKGDLLVNVVETRITATINLSADFSLASVTTSANSLSTAADTTVDAVSIITAKAVPLAVKAGEPILITIDSAAYNIATITAVFGGFSLFPDANSDKFARSELDCVGKKCTFYLNLGFDFFKTPGPYIMSGTAVFKLGSRARRLQQQDDADSPPEQEAPFSLTIFAAEDSADSSAIGRPIRMITTAVAAGGFVAVMALV